MIKKPKTSKTKPKSVIKTKVSPLVAFLRGAGIGAGIGALGIAALGLSTTIANRYVNYILKKMDTVYEKDGDIILTELYEIHKSKLDFKKLGINLKADKNELSKICKALFLKTHPDKSGTQDTAETFAYSMKVCNLLKNKENLSSEAIDILLFNTIYKKIFVKLFESFKVEKQRMKRRSTFFSFNRT